MTLYCLKGYKGLNKQPIIEKRLSFNRNLEIYLPKKNLLAASCGSILNTKEQSKLRGTWPEEI
jgi:hypothetical protein